jgi:hypothetical protein
MSTQTTHRLLALLLCLASTGCTFAAGNANVPNKEAQIKRDMTKEDIKKIMGEPLLMTSRENIWAYGYGEMKWKPWPFSKLEEPEFLVRGLEVSFSPKGKVTGTASCKVCTEPECK